MSKYILVIDNKIIPFVDKVAATTEAEIQAAVYPGKEVKVYKQIITVSKPFNEHSYKKS